MADDPGGTRDGSGRGAAPPDAASTGRFRLGVAAGEGSRGPVHARRSELADGLALLGGAGTGKSTLLANLAGQAAVVGAGTAVVAPSGPAPGWFARALPPERGRELRVVGGPAGRSVNLLDTGVDPESPAFFDAVDAVADGLASLATVASPRLLNCVREFVMTAQGTGATLAELAALVRHGVDPEAEVPGWVTAASPDLLDRVDRVAAPAVERFVDSLSPFLREPARSLLCDPDPDAELVPVVREGAPLAVRPSFGEDDGDGAAATVSRAVTHCRASAARQFAGGEHPFYLFGDAFGPVLAGIDHLDRLLARVRRRPFVPAVALRAPAALSPAAWDDLASGVGARALFAPGDGDPERMVRGTPIAADEVRSLPPGDFGFAGGSGRTTRVTGDPPPEPVREGPVLR